MKDAGLQYCGVREARRGEKRRGEERREEKRREEKRREEKRSCVLGKALRVPPRDQIILNLELISIRM